MATRVEVQSTIMKLLNDLIEVMIKEWSAAGEYIKSHKMFGATDHDSYNAMRLTSSMEGII